MDSEQEAGVEENAEATAIDEPKGTEEGQEEGGEETAEPAKEVEGGGQNEDAKIPSEDVTAAEDAEGKEAKADIAESGDKEAEERDISQPVSSEKDEASTEAKAAEEGGDKRVEDEEKHKPGSTENVEEQAEVVVDETPQKTKTGKPKPAKAGKQKKPPEATEASPQKVRKASKSPRKGGKKKGKKLVEPHREEKPSMEGSLPAEGTPAVEGKEREGEEEAAVPEKSEDEMRASSSVSPLMRRTTFKSEDPSSRENSEGERDSARRPSSRTSSSSRRQTKKGKRSRFSKMTRISVTPEKPSLPKDPFDVEGVVHLVISPEFQAKLECQIGEQVTTEAPWTVIKKHLIDVDLEQNKHSDFLTVQEEIKAYTGDEILVGYHVASDIPNTFYVCLSEASKVKIEDMLKMMEIERKERVAKMMERYAGDWYSLGSEKEIDSWKIEFARPLIEVDVQVNTNRETKAKFEDCDAAVDNGRYFKIGPSRVEPANIVRLRLDEGVQAAPEKILAFAQTYLPFPRNMWTQYLYEITEADKALSPELTTLLKQFLERSYNMVEPVISYNAHFDLYIDDYVGLVQSERDLAKSKEILYKSYNIFFDVVRCKNKMITACDWHPMWSGVVAIAYSENLRSLCTIKEPHEPEVTLTASGTSAALIWSFVDEIRPKLILECPHQIHAIRFCPHDENLLIGGCDNGQVVLWDLTNRLWKVEYEEILTDAQKSYRISLNKHMTWMKRTSFNNIVRASVMSFLEFSPQACITDVRWLSPYAEVNRLGRYRVRDDERKSLQFITSSEDGALYVWDLQAEIKGGPVKPHKKKRSVPEDLKTGVSKYHYLNLIFSPIFRITVKDGMEAGVIRLTFMETDTFQFTYNLKTALVANKEYALSDRLFYTISFQQPDEAPRSQVFLGTIEGHAFQVSWAGYECETGEAVTTEICKYLSSNDSIHGSPVTSVSRSPFCADLVLTVSAKVFAIWREDLKDEPLLWRKSAIRMSCGRWSLYRPSSFLICSYNGSITTWDLLLRSNSHVKEQTISGYVITAAYPSRMEPYQHMMGFADFMGGFRAFTVPMAYREFDEEDEKGLRRFFSRELEARNAFREWEKHWWQKNAYILEEEQVAREEEERRLREEAERSAKEEAKRALEEEEGKKRKKKEKKASWSERYQKKWEEFQESNMMRVIMSLKHFRKGELLSKLQPLEVLHEEEERKKLKYKERLDQAQKLFEDLIYLLFPGTLEPPQSVQRSAEIMFSRIEEIPTELLKVYRQLETKSLAFIAEHEFTYEFSWRTMLNDALERSRILNEQVRPREGREFRYRVEKQSLAERLQGEEEEEEEETDLVQKEESEEGARESSSVEVAEVLPEPSGEVEAEQGPEDYPDLAESTKEDTTEAREEGIDSAATAEETEEGADSAVPTAEKEAAEETEEGTDSAVPTAEKEVADETEEGADSAVPTVEKEAAEDTEEDTDSAVPPPEES